MTTITLDDRERRFIISCIESAFQSGINGSSAAVFDTAALARGVLVKLTTPNFNANGENAQAVQDDVERHRRDDVRE